MSFIYNISTIAKYERKILFRSWFFRIFAILSLLVIGMYGGGSLFDINFFSWNFRSLPTSLIYSNFFLLNIFQSIIAVFLATDFMKRDKKLNTTEVMFIRPMSNLEYIIGKTIGLMGVFIVLNILLMILTAVFVLISPQVEFRLFPIFIYFFLMSIPTLVFVIGISYTIMILVKNQPISFIILLGFIALVIFYLGDKSGYVFDYMAYKMPMPLSDIVGFSNPAYIVIHRLSYLLLGVGLLFFTTWRLNRLPNKPFSAWMLSMASFFFIALAATGFFVMLNKTQSIKNERKLAVNIAAQYFDRAVPEMKNASLKVVNGKELMVEADLSLLNTTGKSIDTLFFSLNPSLKVESVTMGNKQLEFHQKSILLKVVPSKPMEADEKLDISIAYAGVPNMDIAYIDNPHEDVFGIDQEMTVRVDRQFGFYNRNYVLLTKEVLWYPIPGIAYDPTRPAIFKHEFTNFDLTVTARPGMVPVSQGLRSTSDSITYSFDIRDPLPQLSLNIGRFKEKDIEIGGIKMGISYIEGHDYFLQYLSEMGDTITPIITEFLDDYERQLGLFYPYQVFNLVEVPAQFASLPHSWTSSLANVQPQVIYFPEWGYRMNQADFASTEKRIKRDTDRNKEEITEKEKQARIFTNFLRSTFSSEQSMRFGAPRATASGNPYHIFPNYYYFVNYISSDECPVLNYAFESYLMKGRDNPRQMFMAQMTGIGDNEQANLKLREQSLKQIIANESDRQMVNKVLRAKGAYLLTWIEKHVNDENFNDYLLDYLYDNSFRQIRYEELIVSLTAQFNVEMGSFLTDWYNADRLPAFGMGQVEVFETIYETNTVYVVRTRVSNYNDVDGLVKFTFQLGGGRGGGGGGGGFMGGGGFGAAAEPEERIFMIEGNTTKELQMVMADAPRSIMFNTMLSENIPATTMSFGATVVAVSQLKAEEYEIFTNDEVVLGEVGALIVDNRDKGFSVHDPSLDNPLRQFVESRKAQPVSEFVGEGFGQAPSTWGLSANAQYYGKIELSAMVVRSGSGNKTATWKTELDKTGYYEIYVYLNQQRRGWSGPGGPGGQGGGGRRNNDPVGSYFYQVHHDDGVEEVELEVKSFENGWNLLGSFYLSSETATVVLTDKGGADRVVADAVKWSIQR
jgi:ABC-type transport system involved in multi-copper enzyme maturation permease subunit